MSTKMLTNTGKVFENPSDEAITETAFGIIWSNAQYGKDQVISRFEWTIQRDDNGLHAFSLRDSMGEVRQISWGTYHRAIEFPSWREYDYHSAVEEMKPLRAKNEELRGELNRVNTTLEKYSRALAQIHDTNKKAGPHSRSGVTSIIKAVIDLTTCPECGMVRCICGDDSFG